MDSSDMQVHQLTEQSRAMDAEIRAGLRNVLSRDLDEDASARGAAAELLEVARPHQLQMQWVARYLKAGLKARHAVSFRGKVVEQSELSALGARTPNWALNDKAIAYKFIDELGYSRPWTRGKVVGLKYIEPVSRTVVKPAAGAASLGVYLIFAPDKIRHAKDGMVFSSWGEAREHAADLLRNRKLKRDSWIQEEMILEEADSETPASDLKFFSFYGEVAFIIEIRRTADEPISADFFSPDGSRLKNSPFSWSVPRFREGRGVQEDEVSTVEEISSAIPYPYMRIDMLRGSEGLVFGEFTPRPGSAGRVKPGWDRRLGEAWVLAEHRLREDLLRGRDFDAFKSVTGGPEGNR